MTAIKWILLATLIIGFTALIAAFDTLAEQSEYIVVGGLLLSGLTYAVWDLVKTMRKK